MYIYSRRYTYRVCIAGNYKLTSSGGGRKEKQTNRPTLRKFFISFLKRGNKRKISVSKIIKFQKKKKRLKEKQNTALPVHPAL